MIRCSFQSNSANQGAGIWATGTVTIQGCEFDSNGASSGGGIWLNSGTLTIDSCLFRGNGSTAMLIGKGGAVYCTGTFVAQNSTFASNAANQGGGLYLTFGGTLWNCTVAYNVTGNNGSSGGGIHGDVTLESTIVSYNTAGTGPDVSGAVTAKYCALGSSSGFSSFTDQGNNLAFGSNLQLATMPNAVGTWTSGYSIQATSPCKNTGSNPSGALYEGRGPGYLRVVGGTADIGAYEIQPPPTVIVTVNDGGSQRSAVTTLALTFQRDMALGSSPRWELKRVPDNAQVTLSTYLLTIGQYSKTYYLLFTAGPLNGNSLADAVYQFTVFNSKVTDSAGQFLDGNGDGIGGDDYVSPTTVGDPNRIFRLFGDVDGDADVDTTDFIQFRLSFGGSNFALDFDNDGSVSASDFIQFRLRFGSVI